MIICGAELPLRSWGSRTGPVEIWRQPTGLGRWRGSSADDRPPPFPDRWHYILADIRIAQGRLREAVRTYEQSLRLAAEHGEPVWGTADLYVGLSELHRERDDLEAATELLMRSEELGEPFGLPDSPYRFSVARRE